MSTSTRVGTAIPRRFSHVEIPLSPLLGSHSSSNLKENTRPWTLSSSNISLPLSLKRKRSNREFLKSTVEVVIITPKKLKLDMGNDTNHHLKTTKSAPNLTSGSTPTAVAIGSEMYASGSFYCHQCIRKCPNEIGIHCTFQSTVGNKQRRCGLKFCSRCLDNRYGQNANEIKSKVVLKHGKGHVSDEKYDFKCPRCRDMCNCRRCRKAKGLAPTGNLRHLVNKSNGESAASIIMNDPKLQSVVPKKLAQVAREKLVKSKPNITAEVNTQSEAKPILKPLPILEWTPLPTSLSLPQAESRIQIREFVHRFSSIMDPPISKANLVELDCIHGDGNGMENDDSEELIGWVSEGCVKGVVLSLLGFLASEGNNNAKIAMKDIRSAGVNLSKIWAILAQLRNSQPSSASRSASNSKSPTPSCHALVLPSPLPPPSSATFRTTRTSTLADVHIASSAQMVPVLVGLLEAVLATEKVREEIENGSRQTKERAREVIESRKKENERWDQERKELEGEQGKEKEGKVKGKEQATKSKDKEHATEKRETHKKILMDLDLAFKVAASGYVPRAGPLGRDKDRRVYWALTPGVEERDRAEEIIASAGEDKKGKTSRRRGNRHGEEERSERRHWSWFIGVWGKKPYVEVSATRSKNRGKSKGRNDEQDDADKTEDEDVERWWVFWKPTEIRKLAQWVQIKSGFDESFENATSTHSSRSMNSASKLGDSDEGEDWDVDVHGDTILKEEMKGLVQGLEEYASILEWRMRREADD